jgi:hypothetical protein
LQKKIRNRQKKLKEIEELALKIKKKEITANQAQLEKVASKTAIEAEIDEINL